MLNFTISSENLKSERRLLTYEDSFVSNIIELMNSVNPVCSSIEGMMSV
mgnify:CR=1 FL=1